MRINYLDLFSGIGGFALGIQQAGIKFDKHYFSEIDKYATQIYKRHFPNAIELGDIKGIRPETLGKIDLVTFGFPCQDLSIAGKRAGLGGTRSGLFFEAMRIINELRPSVFIFENVKGLLTSNEGKDFEIVLREVADIGLYECEWQLVNTSWVLPQNRERIYFIGHLGEGSGQKVFPIAESDRQIDRIFGKNERQRKRISGDIPRTRKENEQFVCRGGRVNDLVCINPHLSARNPNRKNADKGGSGLLMNKDKSFCIEPIPQMVMIQGGVMRKGEYGDGIKEEKSFTLDGTCGRDLLICQKSKESN